MRASDSITVPEVIFPSQENARLFLAAIHDPSDSHTDESISRVARATQGQLTRGCSRCHAARRLPGGLRPGLPHVELSLSLAGWQAVL